MDQTSDPEAASPHAPIPLRDAYALACAHLNHLAGGFDPHQVTVALLSQYPHDRSDYSDELGFSPYRGTSGTAVLRCAAVSAAAALEVPGAVQAMRIVNELELAVLTAVCHLPISAGQCDEILLECCDRYGTAATLTAAGRVLAQALLLRHGPDAVGFAQSMCVTHAAAAGASGRQ